MIEHIVLFKLRSDVSEGLKEEMLRGLVALQKTIPQILQASAGTNFSQRSRGYTHGFVSRFVDRNALDIYLKHPAHTAWVDTHVKPISEEILALDYDLLVS